MSPIPNNVGTNKNFHQLCFSHFDEVLPRILSKYGANTVGEMPMMVNSSKISQARTHLSHEEISIHSLIA